MMSRVRPRLMTFDVTGTLLKTKFEEHYTEIGAQHGLSVEPEKLARSFKSNFARLSEEHPIYGKYTGLGWRNWWRMIVHNVFRDQHSSASDNTLDKVADSLTRCYSTSEGWHKYPGTDELLDFLQNRNVILGVISNFDPRLESVLMDTQIRRYFAFVLTSYDFGAEKPSLPIFEEALRLARDLRGKNVSPGEAVHIGDSVDNDYIGARSAGWSALLIRHGGGEINEKHQVPREDIFGSLTELQGHLAEVLGDDTTDTV